MSESDPKLWKCEKCGFILGLVRRGSDRRSKLDVLRNPGWPSKMAAFADRPRESFAMVALEQGTVRCGHCGADRTWHMGEQALEDLLENRRKSIKALEAM